MQKIKKISFVFFIAVSLVNSAQAVKQTINSDDKNTWFVGIGAGKSSTNLSNSFTTVANGSSAPSPSDQDYYSIRTPANQTQLQVNAGYRWHKERKWVPYYSAFLQYRHYYSTYIKGSITQYSLPEFENYDYQMKYTADLFTLNGKINLFEYEKVLPYLAAGAGVIYNHLNSYEETAAANVTPRISPGYAGNTNASLALMLGLGVDVKLTKNIWATLGYEYLAQGNINTGNGESTWSGTRLTLGKNTKMNTVFLNISVNIPDGIRSDK